MAFVIVGGLVSEIRLSERIDYLILEAAMSMYELLDLLFSAVQIIITIILHLFPNRKESIEYGRSRHVRLRLS